MVKNENKNFAYTTHRIGGTTYKVKVVFNESATETMEDKILRIVRNEILEKDCFCGRIKTDEPRTLDFSGVRGFLVTNVCIVQRSAA